MKKRPDIINILASSLDGKIASKAFETDSERRDSGFVSTEDKKVMQELLSTCDAVFMGANSLRSSKGALRVPNLKEQPFWVIFSRQAFPEKKHPFWKQSGIKKFTFCIDGRFKSLRKIEFKTHQNIKGRLDDYLLYLKTQGVKKIALLGGSQLNNIFWSLNYVDELRLTLSPRILASYHALSILKLNKNLNKRLKIKKYRVKKDFVYLEYLVSDSL